MIRPLVIAAALALTGIVGAAGPASAHTPNITASCDGVHVTGTNYNSAHQNSVYVSEGGKLVYEAYFGSTLDVTIPVPQDGKTTDWGAHINAWDDPQGTHGWTVSATGTVGPCGTPPPPPPRLKVAHLAIGTFQSCKASERIVYVKHRSPGIAAVRRTHGPHRYRWTVRAHTSPGFVIHQHRDGTGPLVHHVRWPVRLQHLGPCHPHTPGSGRTS